MDTPLNKDGAAKKTLERAAEDGRFPKAKELIEVRSPMGLSLVARRVFNLLLDAAHSNLRTIGFEHEISWKDLRGGHKSNNRVRQAIRQLMTTVVEVQQEHPDGSSEFKAVQLLGGNSLEVGRRRRTSTDPMFRYRFDPRLIEVLLESRIYAILKKEVMLSFESKYALALYELIERRRNLKYKTSDEFTVDDIRALLDVPDGKYDKNFHDLAKRVITPAIEEVNHLCDFTVGMVPLKDGRKVTGLRLCWFPKSAAEKREVQEELQRSRQGRKDRREDTVVNLEQARQKLRADLNSTPEFPGLDDEVQF